MAAALLQCQACLGIMVRLQVEDLTALKRDFDAAGERGLSLREFVGVMLDRVRAWDEASAVQFIQDLVELFAQVDVNGDGTMEWEEFTSAIIEGGMGTMSDELDWRDLQYEEHADFADATNRPPKRVQFLPEFRRLLVHDNTRPVVEIVEPSALSPPLGESDDNPAGDVAANGDASGEAAGGANAFTPALAIVNKFHPLCYIAGYRRDQDDVRSERSPVQALKYLSKVDLLAVSGGDLKLTFWASTILTAASSSALETPLPLAIVHTPRPQRVLEWNATTQHLFSISADLVISVWYVLREKLHDAKGRCEVSLFTTLKQHTDLLQDLLLLNSETLVTCGMDSMIYLWDATTLRVRASRQGHRRGVRSLTKLSNQVFLSAGFECEVLGWDISALATVPIFKMWGHNAPVCCIQLIQSSLPVNQNERRASSVQLNDDSPSSASLLGDQAITVDDDGWFKWWNLANITSMENNDLEQNSNRCLQTFRLGTDKYPWKAHSLAVLNNGSTLLAAGIHKLKLLQRVRLKPKLLPSSVVLYNSVSFTLLTTTDREIKIWDATSGSLLRTFRNIASSDITCVDLDARQRKLVLGTQGGELVVLNYMNGAVLKTWTPHQLHVSALIYCREDQCVLTVSWDRSLRLYDDDTRANSLLRCITDAHDTDIKCMAYCYAMALVATGSADGVIKIWDYIYFLLEDTCSLAAHSLLQTDVTALEFVDPYPLLVSCHENGIVCCWNVSPSQVSVLLFHYSPFLRDPRSGSLGATPQAAELVLDDENKGGICCCRLVYDESGGELLANEIRKGRFLLVMASMDGDICVDDVSQAIAVSGIRAFRTESLPSNHSGSYNPRRRFIRHGKTAKRLKNHLKKRHAGVDASSLDASGNGEPDTGAFSLPSVKTSDLVQLARWKAHSGTVRYVHIVDDPQTIITCSSDKSVRVWSFDGDAVGELNQQDGASIPWAWTVDIATSAELKRQQAREIWEELKDQKLKILANRNQSMKHVARNRRQRSSRLSSSSTGSALPGQSSLRHLTNQHDPNAPSDLPTETERLFKQLQGEATWKQSEFHIARQEAWEKEREKFQQRMKRILRKKAKVPCSKPNAEAEERAEDDSNQDAVATDALGDVFKHDDTLDPATNLLPDSLCITAQELPFDDKDNWSVGGLNRQKQMYGNFHHETVRRSQKVLASKASKLRRMQSAANIDLSPSPFLLENLGKSCIILENVDLAPALKLNATTKKRTSLGQSRSMIALPGRVSTGGFGSQSNMLEDSGPTNTGTGMAQSSPEEMSELVHVKSAPVLGSQPSIKDLFLQQRAVDDKVQRASRVLARTSSMRPERGSPPLDEIGESGASEESLTEKPKPILATRRSISAGRPSSPGMKARKPSLRNMDTTAKKQRIRSDTAVMRQDYFGTYSRDDVVNIFRTFNLIDKDKSGTITLRELVDGAGLFGSTHLRENVMGIFSSVDKDQSGHIDLKELCAAVFNEAPPEVMADILHFCSVLDSAEKAKRQKKKRLTHEQLSELKQLFRLYDTDRNGDIDVDELFNALRYNEKFYDEEDRASSSRSASAHITREDVERIVARFDLNTNSTLDLSEFIELFREEL